MTSLSGDEVLLSFPEGDVDMPPTRGNALILEKQLTIAGTYAVEARLEDRSALCVFDVEVASGPPDVRQFVPLLPFGAKAGETGYFGYAERDAFGNPTFVSDSPSLEGVMAVVRRHDAVISEETVLRDNGTSSFSVLQTVAGNYLVALELPSGVSSSMATVLIDPGKRAVANLTHERFAQSLLCVNRESGPVVDDNSDCITQLSGHCRQWRHHHASSARYLWQCHLRTRY